MDQLTIEELNILIDALDAWERKDDVEAIIDGIFASAMIQRDNKNMDANGKKIKEDLEKDLYDREKTRKLEAQNRKERSILLKAKLIHLRGALIEARNIG